MTDVALMFALGLASSLHCTQMCGPIVLAFGLPMSGQARSRQVLAHGLYHLGRIVTYALLGLLAGYLGLSAMSLTRLAGIEQGAALGLGVALLTAAVLLSGILRRGELVQVSIPGPLARATGTFLRDTGLRAKLASGLLLGCLPCGLIYAALLKSAAMATPVASAMSMAAFGLGTAGPLLGLGVFSSSINRKLGFGGPKLAAFGVAVMGAMLIWRGLSPVTAHLHHGH